MVIRHKEPRVHVEQIKLELQTDLSIEKTKFEKFIRKL